MTDRELNTNEAILAELKKMNAHLEQIRVASEHYMQALQDQKNNLKSIQTLRDRLPRL